MEPAMTHTDDEVQTVPSSEEAPVAKKATKKTLMKRAKAKLRAVATKRAARKTAVRKLPKRRGPGRKGYSAERKAEILAAAKKEGLTGAQAAKKFGISTLTFYRWRGPVRGKKKRGRPVGSKNKMSSKVKVDVAAVRREVQAQVRKMLPQIIREEVAKALR
jgi:transposase-like protein